jgi:type IV pilus assembly protein PilC
MRLALKLPVVGGALKTSALSRLAWTLSLALDSGLDAGRSIRLALRSTQNAYYTSKSQIIETAVAEGREFHEGMREAGVFPDDFLDAMEMAELSGTQVDSLDRLASDYRQRAQTAAKTLTIAATFTVWGGTAVILIALIFRVASFYIGMLNDLTSGF